MPFDAPIRPGWSDTDLLDRLERLPDNHPSSPRYPDKRSPPADSRPFTDAEWAQHLKEVRAGLERAHDAGMSTDQQHTIDPDRRRWSRERRHLHREITDALYLRAAHVPCDGEAIMCGGLGGAGKSTVLSERARGRETQYLTINPDEIKVELARRGLIPTVAGLSPMESSDLVHEESSHVAKQLARRALAERKNIIWDITMSSRESTETRIDELRSASYGRVDGVFVSIPIGTSSRRAGARHRAGEERLRAGDGPGGRYVPMEVISAQADTEWGSRNRKTFEQLKHRFDSWEIYDNAVDGRSATLVDHGHRRSATAKECP